MATSSHRSGRFKLGLVGVCTFNGGLLRALNGTELLDSVFSFLLACDEVWLANISLFFSLAKSKDNKIV